MAENKTNIKVYYQNNLMCTLYDEDFEENSLGVSGSALGSSGFNIGGATANQSSITINKEGLKKLKEKNALRRKARFDIVTYETPDNKVFNKYELGSYYVTELEVGDYSADLVMYDGMICFDEKISEAGLAELRTNAKTISEWVTWTISMCSSPYYAISKDDSSINTSMLNGGIAFKIAGDSRIDTYRNLLEFLSVLACGYFKINTQNKIYFSSFVNAKHTRSITSDAVSNYTEDAYPSVIEKLETSLASFDYVKRADTLPADCDKLTIALYENPFLRSMVTKDDTDIPENVRNILDSIANKVVGIKLSGGSVNYTSSNGILGNFGETIGVSRKVIPYGGEYASETVDSEILVTDFNYEYRNGITLTCNASVSNINPSSSGLNKGVGYTPGGGSFAGDTTDKRLDEIANNIKVTNEKDFFLTVKDSATNLAELPYKVIKTGNGSATYRVTLLEKITSSDEWVTYPQASADLQLHASIEQSITYSQKMSARQLLELTKDDYAIDIGTSVKDAAGVFELDIITNKFGFIVIDDDTNEMLSMGLPVIREKDQPSMKIKLRLTDKSVRSQGSLEDFSDGWVIDAYSQSARLKITRPKGGNSLSGECRISDENFMYDPDIRKNWSLYFCIFVKDDNYVHPWINHLDKSYAEIDLACLQLGGGIFRTIIDDDKNNDEVIDGEFFGGPGVMGYYYWADRLMPDDYEAGDTFKINFNHSKSYDLFHSVSESAILNVKVDGKLIGLGIDIKDS